MTIFKHILAFLILILIGFNAFTQKIKIHRNIEYQTLRGTDKTRNKLDIYAPSKTEKPTEVLIFIHGGSWKSGNKNLYKFIGKQMAKKGKVAVIINYRLSPDANYKDMISDCKNATQWIYSNIHSYGGDKNKITISGHSAGGHLAASLAINNFKDSISGKFILIKCILIDAFGLGIYSYLNHNHDNSDSSFMKTFSTNPIIWKEGSPIYHIPNQSIPYLIFYGTKTYPAIQGDSKKYYEQLKSHQFVAKLEAIKGKKHIGMILQMYKKKNIMYNKILPFMEDE